MSTQTDPPLDPFAERLAARLDRLAERAGPDDGDEAADRAADDEFERLATAVVAQLREEATWTGPPPELRAGVLARALAADTPTDAPADVPPETTTPSPLPPRWRRLRYAVPLAAAAAVLFTFAVVAVDRRISNDTPTGQHYTATGPVLQGRHPRLDLIVASTGAAGFAVTIQPHDLPGAGDGLYYAAWLHKPGSSDAYVPLGSFHARQAASIRLWSGVSPRDYPEFVVTLQQVGRPPTPSTRVVATARLD